jgi:hypothetical protein
MATKAIQVAMELPPVLAVVVATAAAAAHLTCVFELRARGPPPNFADQVLEDALNRADASARVAPGAALSLPPVWAAPAFAKAACAVTEAVIARQVQCNHREEANARDWRLEGLWHGWWGDAEQDFGDARTLAIAARLTPAFCFADITAVLATAPVVCDVDGWYSKWQLRSKAPAYGRAVGFKIDGSTGDVTLRLARGDRPLFTTEDLGFILKNGISASNLRLWPGNRGVPAGPLLELSYSPIELAGSDYLGTMVHCQRLLMMLFAGIEVSSRPPFRMRSADALLARLTAGIRAALDIARRNRSGRAVKFVILAAKVNADTEVQNDAIECAVGDITMGVLVSDPDEGSPEVRWADEFTRNYRAIAAVFPEFARLAELAKLNTIVSELAKARIAFEQLVANTDESEFVTQQLQPFLARARKFRASMLQNPAQIGRLEVEICAVFPVRSLPYGSVREMVETGRIPLRLQNMLVTKLNDDKRSYFQKIVTKINAVLGPLSQGHTGCKGCPFVPAVLARTSLHPLNGAILLDPFVDNEMPPAHPFESIRATALPQTAVTSPIAVSLSKLVTLPQGRPLGTTSGLATPQDVDIIVNCPCPPQGLLKSGEVLRMRVSVAAQKHIFEYTDGQKPPQRTMEVMWEARMWRLIQEVEWEFARIKQFQQGPYQRPEEDVLERGYELVIDVFKRRVLIAHELDGTTWNALRASAGLGPII